MFDPFIFSPAGTRARLSATLLLALSSTLTSSAVAQSDDTIPTLDTIVTAARRPQAADQALASVTVLDRAELERIQAQDVVTLLRHASGIDLARTGGPGSATSVFVRGSNSNHVLVLINGVRVASANTGAFAFEGLSPDLIERIEIVRGPQAALWGSDAIGGVIQIFTKKPLKPSVGVSIGSENSFTWNASAGVGDADQGIGFAVARQGTEGFSSQNAGGFSFDPDRDSNYRTRALLDARTGLGEAGKLELFAQHADNDIEFDQGRSDLEQQQAAVKLSLAHSQRYSQSLQLSYSQEDLNTPVFFSRFTSERTQADWVHSLTHQAQSWTFGLNAAREKGSEGPSRRLFAPFLSFASPLGDSDAAELQLSARLDDDSSYGSHGTYSAAFGFRLSESTRMFANLGTAFRAPNLNELYSPGFDGLFAGNRNLDPERSRSAELGLDTALGAARVQIRAFDTRIDDLISFSGSDFRAENVARARISGAELSSEFSFALAEHACTARINLEAQNPRNLITDRTLLRRAKRKAQVGSECTLQNWEFSADAFAYGERKDIGNATLGGYSLLDLGANWQASAQFKLGFKIENALDRRYALVNGFNTPDRTLWLNLLWQAQ